MIRKLNSEDLIAAVKRHDKEEKEREDSLIDKEEPKKKKEIYDPFTDFIPYDEIKS